MKIGTDTMNALTQFLYRLDDTINKIKLTELTLQYETKVREDANRLQAELLHYKDAKEESLYQEKLYQANKNLYEQSGLDLSLLNEQFATSNSLDLLQNFSDYDTNDYIGKAEYFNKKAENAKVKSEIIGNVISRDLKDAKQFIKGGGGKGYGDPEVWDELDFSLQALKDFVGAEKTEDISQFTRAYVEGHPGDITDQLAELRKTWGADDFYVKRDKKEVENKSVLFLNQVMNTAKRNTNISGIDAVDIMNIKGSWPDFTPEGVEWGDTESIEKLSEVRVQKINVAQQYANAIGQLPMYNALDEQGKIDMFQKYKGTISVEDPGNYQPLYAAIDQSYNHYMKADASLKPSILKSAQLVFGFTGDFKPFHSTVKQTYGNTLFMPLIESNQIEGSIEGPEDDGWDDIIKMVIPKKEEG